MSKPELFKMKHTPSGGMLDFHKSFISTSEIGTVMTFKQIFDAYKTLVNKGVSIGDVIVVKYRSEGLGGLFKEVAETPLDKLIEDIEK